MGFCTHCMLLWKDRSDGSLTKKDIFKEVHINFFEISESLCKKPTAVVYNPECFLHFNKDLQQLTTLPIGPNQIIKSIKEIYSTRSGPHIYTASMDYPHAVFRDAQLNGFGVDFDPHLAQIKAIAEAIERYVYYLPIQSHFIYGSFQDFQDLLNRKLVYLGDLRKDQETWWCEGVNIRTNEPYLLPACSIGISRLYSFSEESKQYHPRSTGFAIHQSRELAINSGFYEYVERHIIQTLWKNGFNKKVDLHELPDPSKFIINLFQKEGYRVELVFDKFEDSFFICWAFIIFDEVPGRPKPALVTGASCSIDPFEAILKSLSEALKELKRAQAIWPVTVPQQPINVYDHFLYYLEEKNALKLVNKIKFEKLQNIILNPVDSLGKDPIAMTKSEVLGFFIDNILLRSLNWHVVQIILPGLSTIDWSRGFYDMPLPFA